MKKKILSIAIMLPLVLIIGASTMLYTQSLSREHIKSVQQMEDLARAGDWLGAQRILTAMCDLWEKQEPLLRIWICHEETDEVSKQLQGVQVGLTIGDEPLLFYHSAELVEALQHLHHRDDLTLSNIL